MGSIGAILKLLQLPVLAQNLKIGFGAARCRTLCRRLSTLEKVTTVHTAPSCLLIFLKNSV